MLQILTELCGTSLTLQYQILHNVLTLSNTCNSITSYLYNLIQTKGHLDAVQGPSFGTRLVSQNVFMQLISALPRLGQCFLCNYV